MIMDRTGKGKVQNEDGNRNNFGKSNIVAISKSKHSNNVNFNSLGKRDRISNIGMLIYLRFFPYQHYFIVTFPFFALLIKENLLIESLWSISYLLPLFFSMIAMFLYNTLCDSETDDISINAIKQGKVSRKDAKIVTIFSIVCSTISALFIYRQLATIVLLCIYNFNSLAYSGLKFRFKTTLFGPFSASFILWTGPALILLADFSYWTLTSIGLLFGIFLVFSVHEIHHQLYDYSEDKQMNVKTFTVRVGKKNTLIISAIISTIGFIFLLSSMYLNIPSIYIVIFSSFLLLYVFFQYITVRKRNSILLFNLPMKAILITFACIYLGFSSLFTILILMVFFGDISGFFRWFKIS